MTPGGPLTLREGVPRGRPEWDPGRGASRLGLTVVLSCKGWLSWGTSLWDSARIGLVGSKLVQVASRGPDKDSEKTHEGRTGVARAPPNHHAGFAGVAGQRPLPQRS